MRTLYPAIEPYRVHSLSSDGHSIYFEECGNPQGVPFLFLHGGPGSGCRPDHRRFFDPQRCRIVLVDQRGAGRSQAAGELTQNTTHALIADLEEIRVALDIPRWALFGGSWGAALALLYGARHPERVSSLILRGSFLAREMDLQWFVRDGAPRIFPEAWMQLAETLSVDPGGDLLAAVQSRLHGADELAQRRVARAWDVWSSQVTLGPAYRHHPPLEPASTAVVLRARIELHYAINRYFVAEGAVLEACAALRTHPVLVIHGGMDLLCPVEAAFTLCHHLPRAELTILPGAGHVAAGEDMVDALVHAVDRTVDAIVSGHA
jgi:proline iminopeptidase